MVWPKGTLSALWPVAAVHLRYQPCPYLSCERPHQCEHFREGGWAACYRCGWEAGYNVGHDDGYADGRNEPDFWEAQAERAQGRR